MTEPFLVYLHGFNSSPASRKAQRLAARMAEQGLAHRLWVPQLPHRPAKAMALVKARLAQVHGPPAFVGSSLGGYYATWLAERHGARAVLINPAVRPYELLAPLIGPQQNLYTGERYLLTPAHLEELRALEAGSLHPERYLLLLETGDEILDWRQAAARYAGARQVVFEGGDHGFSRFEACLDTILAFCGFPTRAKGG